MNFAHYWSRAAWAPIETFAANGISMTNSYIELCIYSSFELVNKYEKLPAVALYNRVEENFDVTGQTFSLIRAKLEQSARKICMMWRAGKEAVKAEQEFYSATIKEAPALFGEDAIRIHYHLEAMVLFARSAMEIGRAHV